MDTKKFFMLFMIMFMLFTVSGCGGSGGNTQNLSNDPISPDKPAPAPETKSDDIPLIPVPAPQSQDKPISTEPIPTPTNPIISPDPIPVRYTVSFNSNGGSTVSSITVLSGHTINKPSNPKKYGSTFKGWYKDSALTQIFTFGAGGDKVTANITLYAKWIEDSVLAEVAVEKVSIGYQDGDSANHVTKNITLPRNIDVSGDVANIIWSSNNEKVIYTNGTVTRQSTDVTVVLTALSSIGTADKSRVFTLKVIHAETTVPSSYTVSFNSNGGSSVSNITVPSGNTVNKPKDPSKNSYTFGGWYKDSTLTQAFRFGSGGDKITGDITLYAKWIETDRLRAEVAIEKISIGYQDSDSANSVTKNLTLPTLVYVSGDVNISWSSNAPSVISNSGIVTRPSDNDVVVNLTAKVTVGSEARNKTFTVKVLHKETPALSGYTVTFNSNGGSAVASFHTSSGGTVIMPENPVREGYVFAGWYKDEAFTEIFTFGADGDKISQDITLYARWTKPEELLANYALSEIVIGYSYGNNPNYVTGNITLPSAIDTIGFYGIDSVNISWSSSNPGVISSAGNVTRQNGRDVNVTIKAEVQTENEVFSRDFNLRVVRATNRNRNEIPHVTVDNIADMNSGNSEANISYGNDKQVIDIDGTFCDFQIYNAEDAKDAVQGIHEALGINDTYSELVFDGATSMDTGVKYCFVQSYDNAEVYGRRVLVSTNASNNTNFMMSSFLSSDVLASADLSAKITKEQAEGIAKGHYAGSCDVVPDFTHQIIYSLNNYETSPVRAFAVKVLGITVKGEYLDEDVIVNARNSEIINIMSNHHIFRVHQRATNEFSKDVDFYTEFEVAPIQDYNPIMLLGNFMRDSETNVQIYKPWAVVDWTKDINLPDWLKKLGSKVAQCFMIQAVRDNWDSSQVSAYTNVIDIMKWWKTTFHRNSLDNRGMKVKVVTHAVGMKNNAAWMRGLEGFGGERINIYDNEEGSSYIHQPSAAADILAHETTHAVMYYEVSGGGWIYTAGNTIIPILNRLPYQNATGAIDEAYADILGCIYDSKDEYGNKDWLHAEDWYGNNECGRNIADPNNTNANDCRLDIQKYFTVGKAYSEYKTIDLAHAFDHNNVHQYSLIVSHAAYLMHKYGMPYDLLGKLWYNTIYYGAYDANSNFHSVRNVVLNAAREKPELRSYVGTIERAFDEVGITEGAYYTLNITISDDKDIERDLSYMTVYISKDNEVIGLYPDRSIMLQEGKYTVSVQSVSEFFPFSQEVDLRCDTTFSIRLSPLPGIHGIIYSSDRVTPLENAEVHITSGRDNTNGEVILSMSTGSDGMYFFNLINQKYGDYTVTIKMSQQTDYFNVTLNGEVTKDWYFLSENEPDSPTPVDPDVPIASYDIPIDEEHFPDSDFRRYIQKNIDSDGNGILSKTEISRTHIYIGNNPGDNEYYLIRSLKGIEYFTSLQTLYCFNLFLISLDVSQNTTLKELHCYKNHLTVLDLSKNIALQALDCRENHLTVLDVSKNVALMYLSCSLNPLVKLDVSKNIALLSLRCQDNQLTELDVSKNIALSLLDCRGNQLTELDVSKNIALQELYCGGNQLTKLDVSKNIALQGLYCNDCQLTALDVSKNTALKELQCTDNKLTILNLATHTSLESLWCYNNQLTTLNLSGCTALRYLSCEHNSIKILDLSHCPHDIFVHHGGVEKVIWPSSITNTVSPSTMNAISDGNTVNYNTKILAVIPAFTPTQSGTYTFTVPLDHEPPEGTSLVLLADSEDIHGSFTLTDSPDTVIVSADFTAGRTYAPVIVAMSEGESQSGGCNTENIGIILLAGLIVVVLAKRRDT